MVYDPCSDELFQTVRGFGAFLNGQRVSSSGCSELGNAVVVRRDVAPGLHFEEKKKEREAVTGAVTGKALLRYRTYCCTAKLIDSCGSCYVTSTYTVCVYIYIYIVSIIYVYMMWRLLRSPTCEGHKNARL